MGWLSSLGLPIPWRIEQIHASGTMSLTTLGSRPGLVVAALTVPLVAAFVAGFCSARWARRTSRAAAPQLLRTTAIFSLLNGLLAVGLSVGGSVDLGAGLHLSLAAAPLATLVLASAWMLVVGTAGAAVAGHRAAPIAAGDRPVRLRRGRTALVVSVALVGIASPAVAKAPAETGQRSGNGSVVNAQIGYRRAGVVDALGRLRQQSRRLEATFNPWEGTPSFLDLDTPTGAGTNAEGRARGWLNTNRALFALDDMNGALRLASSEADAQGLVHLRFQHVVRGVPVYNSTISVHLNAEGDRVRAVATGLRPDVSIDDTHPRVGTDAAVATAQRALPASQVVGEPELVAYTTDTVPGASTRTSQLAWVVWLIDDEAEVSNAYFINARTSTVIHVEDRKKESRNRKVHDLNHGTGLPGPLARVEGQGASPVGDVNAAYDGTGGTYDFYSAVFSRDSYDNAGAALVSSVRYSTGFRNASWDGTQMRYGDGMASLDVTGHELTHAVTERTANLAYSGESGALNESFSDIMGEMVERFVRGSNDWVIGKEAATGALRSMENPALFGQPSMLQNYVVTCQDNGGVHTNSGIPNKAYYNIAMDIGSDKAQQIFYRALAVYLQAHSGFADARAATIKSANEIYPGDVSAAKVAEGWAAVGVDGIAQPGSASCGCLAGLSLVGSGLAGLDSDGPSAGEVLLTLYRFRDLVMPRSLAGRHYEEVWDRFTGRAAELALADSGLRQQAAHLAQTVAPGLAGLSGEGPEVTITPDVVAQVNSLMDGLQVADGRGKLAKALAAERSLIDLHRTEGLTFGQAVENISTQLAAAGVRAGH